MSHSSFASALASAAAGLLLALPAAAEHAAPTGARPDPFDAEASVPPLAYRSAFSDYRPLADDKVGWKEANDEVGRIGGWRSYAKEANAPESPARGAATAAPQRVQPTPAPAHGAHGNKKN